MASVDVMVVFAVSLNFFFSYIIRVVSSSGKSSGMTLDHTPTSEWAKAIRFSTLLIQFFQAT